jgi:AcrR family transcriptional regulator
MLDVAKEANVSAGTLYLYAENKEALFVLALRQALGALPIAQKAPIRARGARANMTALVAQYRDHVRWPALAAALDHPRANVVAEAEAIIRESFAILASNRRLIWLLDRCSAEHPALAELFVKRMRGPYIADLTEYTRRRMATGRFDRGEATATAIAIMEMICWLAMHRHRHQHPPVLSDKEALAAAVRIGVAGLMGST